MDYKGHVTKGFELLLPALGREVAKHLKERYGEFWWNDGVLSKLPQNQISYLPNDGDDDTLVRSLDVQRMLLLVMKNWKDVFDALARENADGWTYNSRNLVSELIDNRNTYLGHWNQNPVSEIDAFRCLDSMVRLVQPFDGTAASRIAELRDEAWGGGRSRSPGPVLESPAAPAYEPSVEQRPAPYPDALPVISGNAVETVPVTIEPIDLEDAFEGYIVRKDLTKRIKEGVNVPVFVLEYLLGTYCSSSSEEDIREGMEIVRDKLSRLYIRPDEAELVRSRIREAGRGYAIIDKVSVSLDFKNDIYVASFISLGLKDVPIETDMVKSNPRLLSGGIWCIITFDYSHIGEDKLLNPFKITRLTPIQTPFVDVDDFISRRGSFTKDQWIGLMLRSVGIEPNSIDRRTRMLLLARMMALVENNINICELGPRSTGKSHLFKEISPSSILVSGGQASVASLFYNLSNHKPGLVCNWDVVAFDEIAEIRFKDKDAIAIMKDYMNSGSFSRGGEFLEGRASMVFVGNMNMDVSALLLHYSLFEPFPAGMNRDTAFLDRFHCYIPGWEIQPFTPATFTDDYGLISDYFSEIARELRKIQMPDIIGEYFELDPSLKTRDVNAIRKVFSAMMKLVFPDRKVDKEDAREMLEFAMEMRSRVKEQLKRIQDDDEFSNSRFIYRDKDTGEAHEVLVKECVELKLRQGMERSSSASRVGSFCISQTRVPDSIPGG